MASDIDPADAEFEAQLHALRMHFIAGLAARRDALTAAWAHCLADGEEAGWLALRDVAHRLAGSAPCYGLDEIGTLARELDRSLSRVPPCRETAVAAAPVAQLQAAIECVIAQN